MVFSDAESIKRGVRNRRWTDLRNGPALGKNKIAGPPNPSYMVWPEGGLSLTEKKDGRLRCAFADPRATRVSRKRDERLYQCNGRGDEKANTALHGKGEGAFESSGLPMGFSRDETESSTRKKGQPSTN